MAQINNALLSPGVPIGHERTRVARARALREALESAGRSAGHWLEAASAVHAARVRDMEEREPLTRTRRRAKLRARARARAERTGSPSPTQGIQEPRSAQALLAPTLERIARRHGWGAESRGPTVNTNRP